MLLNPERIWFGTVTSLNRTTLLPEGGAEAVVEHNFLVMLLNPDRIWFGTVTSLNRTTLLPEGGAEAVVEHNFLVGLMAEED
ncbi:hypothetical protein STEG23_004080 [Scotinomys teguina]